MTLDSQQVSVFLAVYAQGSIGRAALALGVTQPTISRTLQKLEAQLGTALFERRASGSILTEAGESLLPYAEEIDANTRSAIEEMSAFSGRGIAYVRVGAIASIASSILPSAIERLLARSPNTRVKLEQGVEDYLSDALARGRIDIAIAGRMEHNEVPFSRPDALSATLAVIAHQSHPLVRKRKIALAEVAGERWVLPPKTTLPMVEFESRFKAAGLERPIAAVETRSISSTRALVALSGFLSWQPRALLTVDDPGARIVELPVQDLVWRRQFYIFKRRRGILSPGALQLVEELRRICQSSS
jgi:DNA-binding transcriptional LysR family regulator